MKTFLRWISMTAVGALSASFALAQGATGAGSPCAGVTAGDSQTMTEPSDPAALFLQYEQYEQLYPSVAVISQEEPMEQPEVQAASVRLFIKAMLDPRAHSMWVTQENGVYEFVEFPLSDRRNATTWKGPVPEYAVAIIHTHPEGTDERPCPMDRDVAHGKQSAAVRIPVYVLHRDQISKVIPGVAEEVTIRGRGWTTEFEQAQKQLKATNHGVVVTTYIAYVKRNGNHR